MKIMEKVWTKYDKSMTPLMALMCGGLQMVFIHGKLRMDCICGHLHMVNYTWYSCRHVNNVRKLCECTCGCYEGNKYMIYNWWRVYMKEIWALYI